MNIREKIDKLLRWSERYTKTDMLYAAKGGFWLTIGRVVASGCAFVLAIVFANALSKETYGTYKYLLSMAGLLGIFTLPSMATAVIQSVARGYEGSIRQAMMAKLRWGFLATIACIGLALWRYANADVEQGGAFLILAVCVPVLDVFGTYGAFLVGRKLFADSVRYNVIIKIVSTLALITVALLTKNLLWIVVAYFVPSIVLNWLVFGSAMRRFKPNAQQDPGVVSYGRHLSLIGIIPTIASYLDRLLVFHLLGPESLAVYAIATAPPEQIKGFLMSLDNLVIPKFAQRPDNEIRANMRSKHLSLFLLGLVVIGAYVLAAPMLYHWVFPHYPESVRYSQIFALSMFNIVLAPATLYLQAKRRIKEMYWSNTTTSILQIVLMTALTLWQGLLGLVLARVLTRFAGSLIDWLLYRRVHEHSDGAIPLSGAQG